MIKFIKPFTIVTFLFCLLVFILTILDFAALHDIKKDYVSKHILDYLEISPSKDLPDWTATKGEWSIVSVSLYLRFLFFILNIALLVCFYRKIISNKDINSEGQR
jgi:hypothetical protein